MKSAIIPRMTAKARPCGSVIAETKPGSAARRAHRAGLLIVLVRGPLVGNFPGPVRLGYVPQCLLNLLGTADRLRQIAERDDAEQAAGFVEHGHPPDLPLAHLGEGGFDR